jgi:hypothetical protein
MDRGGAGIARGCGIAAVGFQMSQGRAVVELAGDRGPGSMAGDVAADVCGGDADHAAEYRDDGVVDVMIAETACPGREEVDVSTSLAVQHGRLSRLDGLPDFDGLTL